MTDLEITKLCAEAYFDFGKRLISVVSRRHVFVEVYNEREPIDYDPLHDDAQAMALVKKLLKSVTRQGVDGKWLAVEGFPETMSSADRVLLKFSKHDDLNRAICECVAKMQSGKESS